MSARLPDALAAGESLPRPRQRGDPVRGLNWWRSGTRTRLWWISLVGAVVIVVLDTYGDIHVGAYTGTGSDVLGVFAEVAEIGVGFLFWMWRPGNRVGPLLVAYPLLISLYDLVFLFPTSRLAWTIWLLFRQIGFGVETHMLLIFPNGRFWNAWARRVTIVRYMHQTLPWIPSLLFGGPVDGLKGPHSYLYLAHGWSGLTTWIWVFTIFGTATYVVVAALLVVRLYRATPGARRRLLPLFGVSILVWTPWIVRLTFIQLQDHRLDSLQIWWGQSLLLWSAAGATFGLARVRHARGSVADLVVELGKVEPGQVREALARTLGDPKLALGLWLPKRGVWVDGEGRELTVPEDGSRGVTYLGERLAVLVHDRDLLDQPRLLEAVGSAGRLALENERLQAELRAQLGELRDSRSRIVRAADEERRRLERDLHDGAQQRLLGVGLALQLVRSTLDGNERATALVDKTELELQHALQELRELAHGIHPAVLTDQGLAAAVRTLAARAPVPVEVSESGARLPAHVETAAYFVVAEALANAGKHAHASRAWVSVGRENGSAVVEVRDDGVGGADAGNGGSGLRGLADRVGALDGRLSVSSPPGGGTTVTAVIPCAA